MKDSARRLAKYDAKLVGDINKNRIDAMRGDMVSNYGARLTETIRVENETKTILTTAGVATYEVPAYLGFAKRCMGILNKHSGAIAINEICLAYGVFNGRGLNGTTLNNIVTDVFTLDISSCT